MWAPCITTITDSVWTSLTTHLRSHLPPWLVPITLSQFHIPQDTIQWESFVGGNFCEFHGFGTICESFNRENFHWVRGRHYQWACRSSQPQWHHRDHRWTLPPSCLQGSICPAAASPTAIDMVASINSRHFVSCSHQFNLICRFVPTHYSRCGYLPHPQTVVSHNSQNFQSWESDF